eukprot:CAMPEP_0197540478 /NCGR_PEP_ID=MMETSP1318-20131121/65972_1 /TAXON_ID=552666 /ORGANISM="Partenskyella glossopodia, Strain RCC365" /LENGTH=211 /DNA_ID=CAMNT_0043099493 /DNA_START=655 /DNA_END=1290 /DNA_ORIENTATION=-
MGCKKSTNVKNSDDNDSILLPGGGECEIAMAAELDRITNKWKECGSSERALVAGVNAIHQALLHYVRIGVRNHGVSCDVSFYVVEATFQRERRKNNEKLARKKINLNNLNLSGAKSPIKSPMVWASEYEGDIYDLISSKISILRRSVELIRVVMLADCILRPRNRQLQISYLRSVDARLRARKLSQLKKYELDGDYDDEDETCCQRIETSI